MGSTQFNFEANSENKWIWGDQLSFFNKNIENIRFEVLKYELFDYQQTSTLGVDFILELIVFRMTLYWWKGLGYTFIQYSYQK